MPALLELLRQFQSLGVPQDHPLGLFFERTFEQLLLAEGPPPAPIPGYSSQATTAIARSPKGRPLYLCHGWSTGPWTCLLLDIPPVVMGRPIFLKNDNGGFRTITDYRSQKFQRRIAAACIALHLPPPPLPVRVFCTLSVTRTFIAWTQHPDASAPDMSGDLDNYAKNIMDGLQRTGLIRNDRNVASLALVRQHFAPAPVSLDEHLAGIVRSILSDSIAPRDLAKSLALPTRLTSRLVRKVQAGSTAAPKALATLLSLSVRHAQRLLVNAKESPQHATPAIEPVAPAPLTPIAPIPTIQEEFEQEDAQRYSSELPAPIALPIQLEHTSAISSQQLRLASYDPFAAALRSGVSPADPSLPPELVKAAATRKARASRRPPRRKPAQNQP